MHTDFSSKLLLLPLFQGFSRLDVMDIVEKVPLDFHTYSPSESLLTQGEECRTLRFLFGGRVWAVKENAERTYVFRESMTAPWVVQPERLLGLHNRYTLSLQADSEAQTVEIPKQNVLSLLQVYPVFHLNFVNMLSSEAQRREQLLWMRRADSLTDRFRMFLHSRSLRPVGCKVLRIRMTDLADELGATRLRVSNMLAELAREGRLRYSRGEIVVPAFERL